MGYLRLCLILAVIYFHLAGKIIAGPIAVHGFFILSGYVITLVSSEIYNNGWRGKCYFLANRVARVWPTYLACLAISLLVMGAVDYSTELYQMEFKLPTSPYGWLVQFSILGQTDFSGDRYPERILPPAWSLSTEIFYYLLIGLITGGSSKLTTFFFALAACHTAYLFYQSAPYADFYFSMQGPAIAFLAGGMFYHYRERFSNFRLKNTPILIIIANAALYLPVALDVPGRTVPIIYAATLCLGYLIMCLHMASLGRKPQRFEQSLADLTYPLFLLHWPAGALVCYFWLDDYQRTPEVFLLALPLALAASSLVVWTVEMPCKRLRQSFRKKAAA